MWAAAGERRRELSAEALEPPGRLEAGCSVWQPLGHQSRGHGHACCSLSTGCGLLPISATIPGHGEVTAAQKMACGWMSLTMDNCHQWALPIPGWPKEVWGKDEFSGQKLASLRLWLSEDHGLAGWDISSFSPMRTFRFSTSSSENGKQESGSPFGPNIFFSLYSYLGESKSIVLSLSQKIGTEACSERSRT